MSEEALSILVHGPAGAGKTTFCSTGPAPRLLIDAERASRFIQQRKIKWDPMREAPPIYDGSWDMAVVKTRNWETAQKTLEYLKSGNHPFRTVIIDSISEMQVKAMEQINGRNQMQTQHWGKLLQNMGSFLRDCRDLLEEDYSPLQVMALISTSKDYDGTFKPYLQGSISSQVPYLFDITGYLYVNQVTSNTGEISENRFLFTGHHPQYEAKNRVPGLPPTIENPNLGTIFNTIFGITPEAPQAPQIQQQEVPVAAKSNAKAAPAVNTLELPSN